MINWKKMAIVEVFFIILLIAVIFIFYNEKDRSINSNVINEGLLSPRIYSGILPAKSFLIMNFIPLKNEISDYIKGKNIRSSVYVLNIRDGASMGINEEEGYEPASLNKIPLAIIILSKIEEGKLNLDDTIPVYDEDRDYASGKLYLDPKAEFSIRYLLEKMLADSDNTATRTLGRLVSAKDFKLLSVHYLNYYGKDTTKTKNGENFYTVSPESVSHIFLSLYLSTILEPQHSEYLLNLLTKTNFDIRNVANLPSDLKIAHKYGTYYYDEEKFFHDCGIMYIRDTRIFYCVMTKDMESKDASIVVGEIVNKIYNYIIQTKTSLENYGI